MGVFNWQLKREMEYPYPEAKPKRQFAAVFDTNKCISCQTCTVACKTTWTSGRGQEYMFWNNVESKPYGFYPTGWDVNLLDKLGPQSWDPLSGAYQGETVFEAAPAGEKVLGWLPEERDWANPNIGEDDGAGTLAAHMQIPHPMWFFYLARICNHCTYPACVAACPRKAIYKRDEDGVVLVDQERCRGYQECTKACPYKKVMFNPYTRKSEKCVGCYPLVEEGFQTQCVTTCIGKIRLMGFINTPEEAREDNPLDFLVHVKGVATPLYAQYGTGPNVYYIPPIHSPLPFLNQMFGPGAGHAIDTYKKAASDEKLLGLILLFGATPRIIHRFAVKDGEAIGWDERGEEIARVPIREPEFLRPYHDVERDVFRHSIT
jgi:nitrate reductase / nitrite oxidoreductase, beta subunit